MKSFPSGVPEYFDFKVGMEGIQGTSFILMCSIAPNCFLSDPMNSPSGSALPRIIEIDSFSKGASLGISADFEKDSTGFFILSQGAYPEITRISLCGAEGCKECTNDYSDCQSCEFGEFAKDPLTEETLCLANCPNPKLERVSLDAAKCVNCLTEWEADRNACRFSQPFFLKETTEEYFDPFSSESIEITFENSSETLIKLPDNFPWAIFFEVSILLKI